MPLINTADRHAVKVKSAILGENPEKGTPFVELTFENANGETLNGWLYLSPAAFDRSVRVLREVFGFDNKFETLPAQVEGKECSIVTEFETFEGKERLKVKWINSLGGAGSVPLKDAGAVSRLSALAARVPVEAPKATTSAPKAAPAPKADADFPTA